MVPFHHLVWYDFAHLPIFAQLAVVPCHHLVWYDDDRADL